MQVDRLWKNARLATMAGQGSGLGLVDKGLVACGGGDIVYAGPEAEAPAFTAPDVVDCAGRWITPGLVDCHTHIVHGGNRAHEFELRLAGATYEELARAGGGIVSTMKATRAATEDELLASALPRVDALIAEGVTTLEVKSGYGLERVAEMKSLKAARRLGEVRPLSVTTTFLGAHAMPPEAAGDKDAYIDAVCRDMLPAVAAAGLADSVDAFCENIGFTPEQVARVLEAAKAHGLPVKLHAEQLSNLHGAALAARFWYLLVHDVVAVNIEQVNQLSRLDHVFDRRGEYVLRMKLKDLTFFRRQKSRVDELSPWLQPALLFASRCLPRDEYRTWIGNVRGRLKFPMSDLFCSWCLELEAAA